MASALHEDQYTSMIFLEWEMFRTKSVEKIKTNNLCSINYAFLKSCHLWDNVEKYFTAGQATDDYMAFEQWFHWSVSMLQYMYIASLVLSGLD